MAWRQVIALLCTCRVVKEGLVPFRATSYGLHQIMRRNKLLIDRARRMPGFEEGELQTA